MATTKFIGKRIRLYDAIPPTVPTNLTVTNPTPFTLDVSWDASTDNIAVAGYRLYRDSVLLQDQVGLTFTDTGLASETTYTYTVLAYDDSGNESAQSAGVSGTTVSAIPSIIQVSGIGSTGLVSSVTINASTGWVTPTSGKLLVAFGSARDDWIFDTPAGWTALFINTPSFDSGALFYKVSDGTESSVTFVRSSPNNRFANVHMFELDNATSIAQYVEATNPPRTLPGTTAGNLIIGFGWAYNSTTTLSWDAPLIENLYISAGDQSTTADVISTGGDIVGNYTYDNNYQTTIIIEVE